MKNINVNYGGLMGSYDIVVASVAAYSAVFLVAQGLDEFKIGMITSTANLLASFIQPWLGDKVDKSVRLTLHHVNLLIVLPSLALLAGILLMQRFVLIMSMMYVLVLMFQVTLQPFMNAIGVLLMNRGFKVNFGACRAVESAAFAVTSSVLGVLISRLGTNTIIVTAIIGYGIYLCLLWLLYHRFLKDVYKDHQESIIMNTADIALQPSSEPFFRKYPHFKYIIFGSFCFFVGHNFINLFMIQIIENVGGNTTNMGMAIALAAISEVPVMFFFTRINRYIPTKYIMMTAAVFFFVKTTFTFLASSVIGIYGAQLLQALAFGIYIVGSVYYTNEQMAAEDKVKGQSFVTTAHTLGGVVGSSFGGWLINLLSVSHGLIFCIVVSMLGVVAYYIGLIHGQKN